MKLETCGRQFLHAPDHHLLATHPLLCLLTMLTYKLYSSVSKKPLLPSQIMSSPFWTLSIMKYDFYSSINLTAVSTRETPDNTFEYALITAWRISTFKEILSKHRKTVYLDRLYTTLHMALSSQPMWMVILFCNHQLVV